MSKPVDNPQRLSVFGQSSNFDILFCYQNERRYTNDTDNHTVTGEAVQGTERRSKAERFDI